MPDPRDYLIPEETSLWGDEYRAAGGLTAQDMLSWQDANRASQYDMFGYEPEPEAPPEQTWMSPDDFVSWPAYQEMVGGRLPIHEAYDKYVNILAPSQLQQMGYTPEEIAAARNEFSQANPPPSADYGVVGNIWESLTGGFKSGTRAGQAAGNLVAGDLDDLAALVTEQATGQRPNAPLQRFQQAISAPEADAGLWDAIKVFAGAAWDEKEGALNFLAEQFAQSYPSLIGGAGGAGAGALAGPLGALIGGVAGIGAGSASVEVGSGILERVANAAQARGIDPRDTAAVRAMINDPEVYNELRNAALAKGLTVGAADAAVSAFSLGMGKYAAQAARAGSRGRATGFAGAGLAGETVGGAGGEALSQVAAGDQLNYRDIVGEAFGELGPGGVNVAIGALLPSQTQGTPGDITPEDDGDGLDEGDVAATTLPEELTLPPPPNPTLMVGPEGGAFLPTPENIAARDRLLGPPGTAGISVDELPVDEAITLAGPNVSETIDIAPLPERDPLLALEQDSEQINIDQLPPEELPPLSPNGLAVDEVEEIALQPVRPNQAVRNAEMRAQSIAPGTDLDTQTFDRDSVMTWLASRGVSIRSREQIDVVETLLNVPVNSRQAAIADAVDGLASSTEAGAEPLAQALLAISRSIPKERNTRARAQAALEAVLPGVPLAEIPKVVASEAAQKVMADLESGVVTPLSLALQAQKDAGWNTAWPFIPADLLNADFRALIGADPSLSAREKKQIFDAGKKLGVVPGVTNATTPAPTATPTSPLTARRSRGRPAATSVEVPVQQRRGLKRGESPPTSAGLGGLVGQLVGRGPAASNAAPVQQPRGGLRAGVNQEGTGGGQRRGSLRGRSTAAAGGDTGSAGAQPNRLAGARGVSGLAPPIKVSLATTPTERRYGTQEEDVANKEAMSEARLLARAKKQTGGLGKKAEREKKRKIDAVVMDKAEYEKTYPGRNHDDDTNDLLDMPLDRQTDTREYLTDTQRAELSGTTDQALQYLSSVMQSPMARLVADQIRALGLVLPPIRFDPTLDMMATYRMNRRRDSQGRASGVSTGIIVNPNNASLEAVLHEFVHAATMKLLTEPETQIQIDARNKLEALRVYVKNTMPGLEGTAEGYGLTNVYEFVSEALSSSAFQARLASLKLPGTAKSVWRVFKELVMRLLGNRTSVLSEAILTSSNLFSQQQIGPAGFARRLRESREERGITSAADSIRLDAPPASNGKANAVPSSAIVGTKNNVRSFVAYAKDKANPNTTYTLYPVTSAEFRGVKGAGIAGLSRADVEQRIKADGSEVIAPATDTTIKSGIPKNTATKKVGYDSDGNLQSAAFEQKDGTWTYYESDVDVRTDPHARVTKGLSTDAVQRFITARGLVDTPPKGGAVKPGSATVTNVGYEPASWKRRMFQDKEGTLINIGGSAEEAALLRNSRVENKLRQVNRQYVEPARKAGQQLTQRFGKTEDQIFSLMQNLHVVERMQTKMRQLARGNMPQQEQADITTRMQKDMDTAQAKVNAERASNPAYVKAVEQELAPKLKAMADNTIDMNAEYGFIERGEAESIKRAYDFYVPLQKDDKRTTVGKAATGSSTSGDLSFPRMVEQAMRTVARGEQNVVRNEVLKLAEQNLLKIKDTGEVPVIIGPKTHVLRFNKENNSLDMGEDSFVFDRDAIDVYRNGDRIRMKITDPSLLDALNPYNGEERPAVVTAAITALAQINRLISIGKTSMNPAWPPFNFARDVLTSNINLPTGVSRAKYWAELINPLNYAAVLWNVSREAIGKEPVGSYADARAAGAFISHRAFIGLDPIAHSVQAMFKPPLVSFGKEHLYGLKQSGTKVGAVGAKLFEFLSIYPQWAESVPRMAMYKAAKASGLSEEKAGLAAKNASVNFERRGKLPISNYWIFANAKMQGLHALVKTFERQGLLKSGIGVTSVIALGAIAAAMGYEWSEKDKDGKSKYAKIPDFKKDSLLLFKADAAGIPIPQEVVPFYVLGNATVEAAMGGITPGKASARWFTSLMNNVWPGSIPQQDYAGHNANVADFITRMLIPSQLAPLYDTGTNRNTFGREVVSGQENKKKLGMPNSEMGSPNENQLAVNAAKGLYQATDGKVDVAPQQIKLWNNFFNPAAEAWGFWSDLLGDRQPKYVGEEVNPMLRKWKGNATEFYDQEQFDELLAKAKRAKYLVDEKNPNRVSIDKLSPEDQVLARSAQMLDKVDRDGDALFKGYKLMTPERRKLLNDRKRDLVLGGIRRYNEMRDQAIPKR